MSPRHPEVVVRRVYDPDPSSAVRQRVLVDRLWPRGVSKAHADLDEWLKDVAPSTELRRWYDHDVARFDEFARRYRAELRRAPGSAALDHLAALATQRSLALLTATRDTDHSGAAVLQQVLSDRAKKPG